jgi:hypothetical protein
MDRVVRKEGESLKTNNPPISAFTDLEVPLFISTPSVY